MNCIDIEIFFAILFVEIDNWYQLKGRQCLKGKVGRPAKFSDSEVNTLMLASEFLLLHPSPNRIFRLRRLWHTGCRFRLGHLPRLQPLHA